MRLTDHEFRVYVLRTGPDRHYERVFGATNSSGTWPLTLAKALAASPMWKEMPSATLIVRSAPDPLLGVIGRFNAADEARLEALRWQLEHVLPHLTYVGYAQAEADCERLAGRLVKRFGRDELRSFRFVAIPRGGHIVLGMLAYVLGLRRSQLEAPHPSDAPLIIVDDCALSGVRFKEFLEHWTNNRIVFAHLYSPLGLRDAIEAEESREVTCMSANDVPDRAPERLGKEYAAWRERWFARMDCRGYWVGQHDQVCFAWNEPDIGVWNPITEREETGWRIVPPELCLKNRSTLETGPIQVQVQSEGNGPLKPTAHLLFGEFEGQVTIGNLKTEENFVLDGVGADMWRAVVEHGDLEAAAEALLDTYEVDGATLRADLRGFVKDLLSQGLLENRG